MLIQIQTETGSLNKDYKQKLSDLLGIYIDDNGKYKAKLTELKNKGVDLQSVL